MGKDVYFECVDPIAFIIDRVHQMHDELLGRMLMIKAHLGNGVKNGCDT